MELLRKKKRQNRFFNNCIVYVLIKNQIKGGEKRGGKHAIRTASTIALAVRMAINIASSA